VASAQEGVAMSILKGDMDWARHGCISI
jgi:hypothetical protein